MLFLACASQWNVVAVPMGMEAGRLHYVGLRYEGCETVMRKRKIRDQRRALDDLRVMEAEAKRELNRKRD